MILNIFKKYNEKSSKKKIIITIIEKLNINETQKQLYLDSVDFLDDIWLEKMYNVLQEYVVSIENKEYENISKQNFSNVAWLRKKEALEKQKEINSFWFLLNNI
mgnify:CR=1 FL=1